MIKNIDVIIPVKDRQNLLKGALDSVNRQKQTPSKVIIVDDCSLKKIQIKKKYKFKIIILRNKINKGVSFSRNKGALYSKNKYISFLDSDDLWTKDKLRFQYEIIKKFNLDFFSTDLIFLKKKFENEKKILIKNFLQLNSFPNPSSIIIDRKKFLKIGGFDERLSTCEDNDLWIKILFSNLKILTSVERKVKTNKFAKEQLSRNFYLRKESVQFFLNKNKKKLLKHTSFKNFSKFGNNYVAKAYIPILKKSFVSLDIKVLFYLLPILISKTFFYKRFINFFLKKLA